MEKKKCKACDADKLLSEFYKCKTSKDGVRFYCKTCENKTNSLRESNYRETRKNYRQTQTYKQIKRDYYVDNKEKILAENSDWRQTLNGRLASYKKGAKNRDIEWCLTKEEFKNFWQNDCSYCGAEIKTIGIDRKDNTKGYILDNCQPCCTTCNRMKLDLNEDEFVFIIKKILKHISK